jgi:DNA-binding transcriptional LysR family regulator
MLICAAKHPLANAEAVRLDALANETFVDFPVGWGTRAVVDRAFATAGIDRQVSFEVADYTTAAGLVATGLGVAFIPASTVLGLGALARVPVEGAAMNWRILVATSATRRPSAAARAFLAELLAHRGNP